MDEPSRMPEKGQKPAGEPEELPLIREVIVVEGKDDVAAVKRACRAELLTTSGLGLSRKRLEEIRRARERRGVIILTDPDGPGAIIRQKIDRAVPGCKHAYIYKDRKAKFGHVGVEYASPEEIRQALAAVSRMETGPGEAAFTMADLVGLGLAGGPGAGEKRDLLARRLGLGQTNAKQFLRRLNSYGISRREFAEALEELEP